MAFKVAAGGRTAGLAAGGLAAVRPGRAARAPRAPGQGERGRGQRSEPPRPGTQAFSRGVIVGTMNGGENDLFSGQCPRQRGHGMKAWQSGHGTPVPLPPQNADNT
jgi:hypothetical protein